MYLSPAITQLPHGTDLVGLCAQHSWPHTHTPHIVRLGDLQAALREREEEFARVQRRHREVGESIVRLSSLIPVKALLN